MSGSFTLIEDDGISNDHTTAQVYTELSIWFKIVNDAENVEEEVVVAGVTTVREKFQLPYEWVWFVLPKGDRRRVLSEGGENLEEKTAEDGATMFGLKI
jgi:alpha-glucosidase